VSAAQTPLSDLLPVLRELLAVKEMREEILRRKARRAHSILRNPSEVRAVADLHADWKVRDRRAWNAARIAVAKATRRTA